MDDKKTLFQRIQSVSDEIMGLTKDMNVSTGSNGPTYRAISDKMVTLEVKKAESKHGIISIPYKQELIKSETLVSPPDQYGKCKTTYVDIVKMTLRIVCVEDDTKFIDIESFGRGVDASDKGFGKASTYARKYAILNAYKIATGVDPDEFKSESPEVAATDDITKLKVLNYLLLDDQYREKTLSHFGAGSIDDLTKSQIATIHTNLTKKGLL